MAAVETENLDDVDKVTFVAEGADFWHKPEPRFGDFQGSGKRVANNRQIDSMGFNAKARRNI